MYPYHQRESSRRAGPPRLPGPIRASMRAHNTTPQSDGTAGTKQNTKCRCIGKPSGSFMCRHPMQRVRNEHRIPAFSTIDINWLPVNLARPAANPLPLYRRAVEVCRDVLCMKVHGTRVPLTPRPSVIPSPPDHYSPLTRHSSPVTTPPATRSHPCSPCHAHSILESLQTDQSRRGGRAAEGDGLLNHCRYNAYRRFESYPLRHRKPPYPFG